MKEEIIWRTCELPRILWIELTSRCPFDCIFCTRKTLRGTGEHMDFALYQRLIAELVEPQIIRLNYAGESGHYPHLAEAVRLAAATGAEVELVTALASLKSNRLESVLDAGLSRLTVSLHTLNPDQYQAIYRFGSLTAMKERLQQILDWRERNALRSFTLDFAFVAMERNLEELPAIALYAQSLGIEVVAVHPLIGRDPLPLGTSLEHNAQGEITESFRSQLLQIVQIARLKAPNVKIHLSSYELYQNSSLNPYPQPWPWPVPAGGRIADCDQSPFETVHILSDGRVVACEVTEKITLGSLRQHSLREIWHNEAYRIFREQHLSAQHTACANCIYKRVYRDTPAEPRISKGRIPAKQLLRGWYPHDDNGTLWSTTSASFWLPYTSSNRYLKLRGALAEQNMKPDAAFMVNVNGILTYQNNSPKSGAIDLLLPLPESSGKAKSLLIELTCKGAASPKQLGQGNDVRILGFSLISVELVQ